MNHKLLDLQPHDDGVLVPVKALPGSRADAVRGVQNGALKVSVTQSAEKGKANKAIRDLLAKSLGVRKSQVELAAGPTSQRKHFLVRDVSMEQMQEAVLLLVNSPPP